jgi:arylsulfatase A-like enzyme
VNATLTRRDFLKVAGVGVAGAALIGASACNAPQNPFRPRPDANVVLITIDSLRKDHVGAYGGAYGGANGAANGGARARTPNLDALARDSLRFTRAYPECMPTIPTRRAVYTGRRTFPFDDYSARENGNALMYGWLPIPQGQPSIAEYLGDRGCETLLVTDNYHQFKSSMNFHKGFKIFEFIRGQETDRYKPYWIVSAEQMNRYLPVEEIRTRHYLANVAGRKSEEDYFPAQVFLKASELVKTLGNRQPFFMSIDCFDPHEPWDPPEKYVSLYDEGYDGPEPFCPRYGDSGYLTERQVKRMRALYAGEVTMTDRWLGEFLGTLEDENLMDDTLVVLLSDHGHLLGERNLTGKPHEGLWPELTDIPFMIRHPEGKKAGETSDFFASTHDVAPTILGFLGAGAPNGMEGRDLSVIFEGKDPEPRPYFTIGYHDHVWARDERHVMFCRNDGSNPRLFDVQADPEQRNDLAAANRKVVDRMFEEYVRKDAGGDPPIY